MRSPRFPEIFITSNKIATAIVLALIVLGGLVFFPGVSGPFVFDDDSNLLQNSYVRISDLNADSLYRASYSLRAGPLHRPLAMVSFALNHYFAGGFDDPTPFKLTNVIIHVANAVLIFLLLRLAFARLVQVDSRFKAFGRGNSSRLTWLAGAITLVWLVHPIQITSVLYVVQRMTSLSAFFTLLGLLCYLKGRLRMVSGINRGAWLILGGASGFGALGVLCKESAALLPLFILAMEAGLFRSEWPWRRWGELPRSTRWGIVGAVVLLLAAALTWFLISYALPRYAIRHFTMVERLLTESRVLFFYLSLILLPRIDRFALHHDDIALSTSLIAPWTTFPSVLGILALLVIGVAILRKYPLLGLGILWFFAGHAMESTFLSLEIAHEHRNYLASLGVWLVIAHLIVHVRRRIEHRISWLILMLFAAAVALVAVLRSDQWSDLHVLTLYEAKHHPQSADSQNALGVSLARRGRYSEAADAFRRAAGLNTFEPIYMVNLHVASLLGGAPLGEDEYNETVRRIRTNPHSGSILLVLENIGTCLQNGCKHLQPLVIRMMRDLIETLPANINRSFPYYLLGLALTGQGDFEQAIDALKRSHQEDRKYLHPLIDIVKIHIQKMDVSAAERALSELRSANERNLHPRDNEIRKLAALIEELRQ